LNFCDFYFKHSLRKKGKGKGSVKDKGRREGKGREKILHFVKNQKVTTLTIVWPWKWGRMYYSVYRETVYIHNIII